MHFMHSIYETRKHDERMNESNAREQPSHLPLQKPPASVSRKEKLGRSCVADVVSLAFAGLWLRFSGATTEASSIVAASPSRGKAWKAPSTAWKADFFNKSSLKWFRMFKSSWKQKMTLLATKHMRTHAAFCVISSLQIA